MQAWSGQNSGNGNSPLRRMTVYVLLGFALTGLLTGFAFGGFLQHNSNNSADNTNSSQKNTPVTQATKGATPTATVQPVVKLAPPIAPNGSPQSATADSTTVYSLTIQTLDDAHHQPVHAPDITCKLWLVHQIPANQILNIDEKILAKVDSLKQPIPGKVNDQDFNEISALGFDATTQQTALCNAQGQMTWKFTVASGTPAGNYNLVVLTDWRGIHWNWSWFFLAIQ